MGKRWKIYYGDGSTFADEDGAATAAPSWGVQAVAQESALVGREVLTGKDFYLWRGGEWHAIDLVGLLDHLTDPTCCDGGPVSLKVGRTIPTEAHRQIVAFAVADPYLPRKSARTRHER